MKKTVLGLGSSLGDREYFLRMAIVHLHHHPQIRIVKMSSLWASLPIGEANNLFTNMVLLIQTALSARELLQIVLDIEASLGRKRGVRWSDRTIDIDILLMGSEIHSERDLIIPHPEMWNRGFVVLPLLEVAKELIHPVEGRELAECSFPPFYGLWKIGRLFLPFALG